MDQKDKLRLVTGDGSWHTAAVGGVPPLCLSDGPHGLRKQEEGVIGTNAGAPSTCYPTAAALSCSWDAELTARVAGSIAEEAQQAEVSIVLGPGVNIKRSPLGGRNFEYLSEDPLLAGALASAYVKAVEAKGVGTSLKHFAGNSQETRRNTANSMIDERALREIYLAAFERVVKEAKPATIMAAYNRLNGAFCCENRRLLTDILRGEWGYEGMVLSDWGACADLPACIAAGMDLEMPDSHGFHYEALRRAAETGALPPEALDRAVERISAAAEKYAARTSASSMSVDPHAVALEAALGSAVLLKNDGILPLREDASVKVIGVLAREMHVQGGGSSHISIQRAPDAAAELERLGLTVRYAPGYRTDTSAFDALLEAQALNLCKQGDVVLFFGGLTDRTEGEGFDRRDFTLPENQLHLLGRIRSKGCRVIFVAFGGSPFAMDFIDGVSAVLHMMLPGEAGGEACAALLTGRANPCGKLSETWPLRVEDTPCYDCFGKDTDDVEYRESLFVGYRYYDTFRIPVRFPFGFGLSYTHFTYGSLTVEPEDGKWRVSFDVTNDGGTDGCEIAQVYVKNPQGSVLRPGRELRGFTKLRVGAGETVRACVTLDERAFSAWHMDRRAFAVVGGDYEIQVASSLDTVQLRQSVTVEGVDGWRDDRAAHPAYFRRDGSPLRITSEEFAAWYGRPLSRFDEIGPGDYTVSASLSQLAKHSFLARTLLRVAQHVLTKMYPGRAPDDAELMMLREGLLHGTADFVALQSGGMIPYRFVLAAVEEANGHPLRALAAWRRKKT